MKRIWRWLAARCVPDRIAPTSWDTLMVELEGARLSAYGVLATTRDRIREASIPTELVAYVRTRQGNQPVGRIVHVDWLH